MSIDPGLKEAVNTPVSSEVFRNHEEARFWIGKVAVAGEVTNEEIYDSLLHFRANVYVRQMHFLDKESLDVLGREIDSDDARSTQFTVVENQDDGKARLVGTGRLILKRNFDEPLPIEKYFPEVFEKLPIEPNSVEVSRFISRHEDDRTQHTIALSVIRTLTLNSVEQGVRADYCIIEEPLLKLLKMIGLPIEVLGEAKQIDEYGGKLYPVKIDPYKVLESVTSDKSGKMALKRFFGREIRNNGEGFYGSSLTGGLSE